MKDAPKSIPDELIDEIEKLDGNELREFSAYIQHLMAVRTSTSDQTVSTKTQESSESTDWSIEPWKKYYKANQRRQEILLPDETQ